ncbi:hypothetical protein LAG90_17015 [Marinilongibacter aquaticus]|uniref:hypothetical protein n=1 Tax=Marinilongibacter aquaticus TaxID=2975157 RepID=UPI0021BD65B6|nr:hypothetical protein [Marinilongibacter aquaticus]UBM58505.1 hypothetical protein LAG90_17015 [Marinilongibacter aquaticus]
MPFRHYATFCVFVALGISACQRPTYRYFHPTSSPALFANAGEVQLSGDLGSSGYSAKAAVALPAHIGITGMYNSNHSIYSVKEGEIGVGKYREANPGGTFFQTGIGFGQNHGYADSTLSERTYEGKFVRPFVQANLGISGGTIYKGLKGDAILSLRADYFIYNGHHLNAERDRIHSQYFLFEPGFLFALGSKNFRTDLSFGFPIRPSLEPLSNYSQARTFPITIGFGIRFILGRKDTAAQIKG